ncbi:MAG TPA: hypothetical protein VHO06_21105 [Polyangia bacterium]|nr:hypothetical protein [Polyangia bacterium]
MLQRIALGQTRFNLPGLVADARGAVIGRQLCARFAGVDRLVSFLRLLSAEQSLDDLQPGLRIVYARGGAGTREAIVLLPASPEVGEVAAHAARLAGGQVFTGAGKHLVQFRDARAPLGYDVEALAEASGDLVLYGLEQTIPYRIESELPLGKLLLRLSLVRLTGRAARPPEGPVYLTARRGLGTVVAGMLHRAAGYAREPGEALRASAALCESRAASAFSPGSSFWVFRIDRPPARLWRLLSTTPGLELYVPVTDNVAVAAGYRHPIHLEACRGSFAPDCLHLFSPRGVTEVAPFPTLAAVEDLIRIRAPAPEIVERREAAPAGRPDLAVSLRLEAGGDARRPVAALVPWGQAVWLQRLVYALPPTALRSYRVVLLKRGVLVRAADVLEGLPFGTIYQLGAPEVLVPLGTQIRPAASPQLLAERLGATEGAMVLFPDRASPPVRILREAIVPFDRRLLVELEPALANLEPAGRTEREPDEAIEIENQPLGPMPLWGLGRTR